MTLKGQGALTALLMSFAELFYCTLCWFVNLINNKKIKKWCTCQVCDSMTVFIRGYIMTVTLVNKTLITRQVL